MITKESHKRSVVRSILWRLLGVGVLATITYILTGNWIQTGLITILHHSVFIFVYYLHERLWQRIKMIGIKRSLIRMLLYEIILGQGILAAITFLITGNVQTMTLVTITYIWNKLWIYTIYDWLWKKIKWGIRYK